MLKPGGNAEDICFGKSKEMQKNFSMTTFACCSDFLLFQVVFLLIDFFSFRSDPNVHYLREEPTSPPQEPLSLVRQIKRLLLIGQAKQNLTGR
jgi:hypothetical protein